MFFLGQNQWVSLIIRLIIRLGIDADEWLKTMRPNGSRFVRGIGSKKVLQAHAKKVGKRWLHGMRASQCLFA